MSDTVESLRIALAAAQARITALSIDRGEAIGRLRDCEERARSTLAEAQRQQAVMDSVREQIAGTEARALEGARELEETRAALMEIRHVCDEMIRLHDEIETERDQLRADLQNMTRAVRKQAAHHHRRQAKTAADRDAAIKHAERLGEEVARLKAEDERATEHLREMLRKVDEEQNGMAICSWCALPTNSDEASKHTHQMTCPKSPIVALLGRAVAALQEARGGIATIYHLIDSDREIKAMKACKPITDKIDAILADATAAATVDAYRAQQEERDADTNAWSTVRKAVQAMIGIVREGTPGDNLDIEACALEALQAIDARRGGGR